MHIEFFTIDTYFGLSKTTCFAKDILTALKKFDKANEDLAKEVKRLTKENEKLRRKYEKVKSR